MTQTSSVEPKPVVSTSHRHGQAARKRIFAVNSLRQDRIPTVKKQSFSASFNRQWDILSGFSADDAQPSTAYTYRHCTKGEPPYILGAGVKLEELDVMAQQGDRRTE